MTLELLTASHSAIVRNGSGGCVPVRSSIGLPRFHPPAKEWEFASNTAPYGLLDVPSHEFTERYLARLDRLNDKVRAQLNAISYKSGSHRLVLCCFEKIEDIAMGSAWCHRHVFADWWEERTGDEVPELNWDGPVPRVSSEPPRLQLPSSIPSQLPLFNQKGET